MLSFKKIFYTLKPKQHLAIVLSVSLLMLPVQIQALPSGQRVVAGSASFRQKLNNLNITASNKAIINYNSFNIGTKEGVRFIQPSMNSVVLNRVIQANPSSILGSLNANGKVFLVNPAGIFFGANSVVNANSFLATTLNISNDDFLSGNYQFQQMKNMAKSYIIQKGSISVSPQGFVTLASPFVSSEGSILAKAGHVNIGATDNFYIQFDSGGLIRYDYQKNPTTDDKPIVMPKAYANSIMNDVINTDEYNDKLQIVQNGDKIELSGGSGTAMVSGKINTDATADATAGTIEVKAQNNALLLNHAKLQSNAATNGNGGNILIYGDKFAYGDQGATLEARGGTLSGNGGFTELSAKKSVILNGTYVDTSAQNGNIGTFLIDPEDLNITSSTTTNSDYNATADNSITLDNNVSISTNGGDINFMSPSITLDDNSKLLAGSGDITLAALQASGGGMGVFSNSDENASIDIKNGVKINGANIKLSASSSQTSLFDNNSTLSKVGDFIINTSFLSAPTPIAYTNAQTTSTIDIGAATITGQNIDISSQATSDVSVSALFAVLALSYGKSWATSSLHVKSGATLTSTGDLTLESKATSNNKVLGKATNVASDKSNITQANFSLAYSNTLTSSDAIVDSGAAISANNFKLLSIGNKDITTSATSHSISAGTVGVAVAISKSKSNINSILGGTVTANNVEVNSTTNINRVKTSSSAGSGNGFVNKFLFEIVKPASIKKFKASVTKETKTLTEGTEGTAPDTDKKSGLKKPALSAAFAYAKQENNSTAKISSNANVKSDGNVTVNSNIVYGENGFYPNDNNTTTIIGDRGIKTVAIATVDTTEQNPKSNSFGGAVALTNVVNNSDAFIDDDAIVDAIDGKIGVYSKIYLGYNLAWKNFEHFHGVEDVIPAGESIENFRGNLFTSYAQSSVQGTDNSLAGAWTQFKFNSNIDAHIGKNVSINQNRGNGAVEVLANNDIQALNFSGIIGWLYFGTKAGSKALGGSYLDTHYTNNTKAYIQKGTDVNATNIKVAAIKNAKNISISTAGGSGKYAISGSFSYLTTDDNTYAYIDGVTITTSGGLNDDNDTNLKIDAENNIKFFNATGGIIKGENVGVGLSGSLNYITRDTQTYINDSTINRTSSSLGGLDYIKARNNGWMNTIAIAAVAISPAKKKKNKEKSADTNSTDAPSIDALPTDTNGTKSTNVGEKGKFGFAVSGDASVNEITDDTNAYIEGTIFNKGVQNVKLLALNDTSIRSLSGSGAFNFSKKSAGLAGSYAGNYFFNQANAYIKNSTLNVAGIDIQAKNSGTISTLSGSGDVGTGIASIAGSVSLNEISNKTNSYVDDSNLTLSSDLNLNSTDNTAIKSLAGALSFSTGGTGIGLSFAKNRIHNNIASYIQNSSLNVGDISIESYQNNTIKNIAASIGGSVGALAVDGSVSINDIDNSLNSYIINTANPKTIVSRGDISIESLDKSRITSAAGFVGGAKNVGIGGAILHNKIANNINSYIKDANIQSKSLTVKSISDKNATGITVGGAGAGTTSIAGGVLINHIEDKINAYVDGSTLNVANSMLVHTIEQNKIRAYGGTLSGAGTVGIGGTVVVNEIANNINAYIKNSTVDVNGSGSLDIPKGDGKGYNETESFNGLSVLALSSEDIGIFTANASGGGTTGIAASVSVNNIEDTINSYIDSSYINQVNSNPDALQSVRVRAINQDNVNILGGGLAIGGTAGVNGTSDTTLINNTSNAYIYNSLVQAANLVEVTNTGYTTVNSHIVSGAGAGIAGVAGNVEVVDINNSNIGDINNSSIFSDGNTNVLASDTTNIGTKRDGTRDGILVGSLGVGGAVGVGGSVIVTTTKQNAQAHVDDSSLNAKGAMTIASGTNADVKTHAASGALGGYVGAGGAVTVNTIDATSKAYTATDGTKPMLINQNTSYQNPLQSVTIKANSDSKLDSNPGVLSIGLVGASGSVDVGTIRNTVLAKVGNGVKLYSGGNLLVQATSNKDANSDVVAYGGGGLGVSGAVSIININNTISADELNASKNTQDSTNSVVGKSQVGDQLGNSQTAQDTKAELDAKTTNLNVNNEFNQTALNQSIYAGIGSGSTVHTGGLTDINTTDTYKVQQLTGSSTKGLIGVGGAVSVANIGANDKAMIGTGSSIDAENLIINSSLDTTGSSIQSDAAEAGVVGGLGAAVSIYNLNYENDAYIGSNTFINNANDVNIMANSSTDIDVDADGAKIGAVAIGATISRAYETGTTQAYLDSGVKIADANDLNKTVNNLTINAVSIHNVRSESKASSGGVISGMGTLAKAMISPTVKAYIGDNANVDVENNISIQAIATIASYADAEGIAIGGIGVGVSLAKAIVEPIVNAYTGDNVNISAENLLLSSTLNPEVDKNMAESEAIASAGTLVVGAQFSKADSDINTAEIKAWFGNSNTLKTKDDLKLIAFSDASGSSKTSGISAGMLALGGDESFTDINTTTTATVGSDANTDIGGLLQINANSNHNLWSEVKAGAGGLVSGDVAKAETNSNSNTQVNINESYSNKIIKSDKAEMTAEHHSKFDGKADSSSASVVGGSGAWLDHNANSNTEVNIGKSVRIDAPTGIQISALNDITRPTPSDWSVKAGAGGVAAGAAAVSKSNINNQAKVIINDASSLISQTEGDDNGDIDISALNKVYDHDLVKLDAGGAISGGDVKCLISNKENTADVDIDPGVSFISSGDISVGSRASIDVDAEARAKTYGLASASAGTTQADINVDNNVNVDKNVNMFAKGNIYLSAGDNNILSTDILAYTDTRLWNKSVLPITSAKATTNVTQSNLVTVGSGSNLRSVLDIYLTATKGEVLASAYGASKSLYDGIGDFTKGILKNDPTSIEDNSGEVDESATNGVDVDGILDSGIYYQQFLTIDKNGTIIRKTSGIQAKITPKQNVSEGINDEIRHLQELAKEYSDLPDVSGAFKAEIDILSKQANNPIYQDYSVPFIDVNPVTAAPGNVHIKGDYLIGSGSIKAPGDAKIDIANNSPYFLSLSSLTIPAEEGGRILFNNVPVSSKEDINERNPAGYTANFSNIEAIGSSDKPQISVVNTYDPNEENKPNIAAPQMNFNGDVSNLRGELNINSTGSVIVAANMEAQTINIKTDGDFIKGFTWGFYYTGGSVQSWLEKVARNSENGKKDRSYDTLADLEKDYSLSPLGTTIAAQNIFISAEKLDINGLIQSGIPDRKITINNSIVSQVNSDKVLYNNGGHWSSKPEKLNGHWSWIIKTITIGTKSIPVKEKVWVPGSTIMVKNWIPATTERYKLHLPATSNSNIQVYYNAKTNKLELEPVSVRGGYLELYGDIFSTSNTGKLKVLDGYGKINVDNQTNYPLEVKRLDAGSGVEGMIKITDTSRRIVNGSIMNIPQTKDAGYDVRDTPALVTIYRHLGNDVTIYNNSGTDDKPDNLVSKTSGRSSSFMTTQGRRYDWVRGQDKVTKETDTSYIDSDTFFGMGTGAIGKFFANNSGDVTTSTVTKVEPNPVLLPNGTTLRFDGNDNYYTYKFKRVTNSTKKQIGKTEYNSNCIETDCFIKKCWCAKYRYTRTKIYETGTTEFHHHSVKASFPIDIEFSGYDQGNVDIESKGDIYISGLVHATDLAKVTSSSGSIFRDKDIGEISAKNIQLSSPRGGIGITQRPLNTDILQDGTLAASAKNSIFINETAGQMKIKKATSSTGDVSLSADTNIITTPGTVIDGAKISLESRYGAIGSGNNIFNIDSNGTVDAKAAGDIWLNETDGDLGIDQVHSYGGDVFISVANGNLLDENHEEVRDPKKETGLLSSIWKNNRLQGADANASRDDNLANIYERYWREKRNLHLDENGSIAYDSYDPNVTFAFTTNQKNNLRDSGWSDDQITHQENVMTGAYQEIGKSDYSSNYRSYNTDKTIDNLAIDSAFSDLVRGYKWTDDELNIGISAALFKETTNTRVRIEDPNIIAHNITLDVNGQVGTTKGNIVIKRQATPQSLTKVEKLALAAAERSDLNITTDKVVIAQNDDFNIVASDTIDINATGNLFLGSQKNVKIGKFDGDQIRVKTEQGIYMNYNIINPYIKSKNDLILEAAEGGIGTSDIPVITDIASGHDLTARAKGNISIFENQANMNIQSIFSDNNVTLTAFHSIVGDNNDGLKDIECNSLILQANQGMGSADNPLVISVASLRALNANSGDIAINSTGNLDAQLAYNMAEEGNVYLKSDGNMKFNYIKAPDTVSLDSQNGSITQDNNTNPNSINAVGIQSDKLILHAKNGIGDNGVNEKYLDLAVNTIDAYNESANDIALKNSKDLSLQDLNNDGYALYNGGGAIKLLVNGDLNQSGAKIFANGDIDMQTAEDIFASNIKSNHNITLDTTNGGILGDPAISPNLISNQLDLSAANDIGSSTIPLSVQAMLINKAQSQNGYIYLQSNDDSKLDFIQAFYPVSLPINYFIDQHIAVLNNRVISGSLMEEYYRSLFPVYKNNLFLLRSLFMKYGKIKKELPSDLINLSFL